MEGLKLIPYVGLVICISGVILGASQITQGKFGDTIDKCFNGSYSINSDGNHCNATTAINVGSTGKESLNLTSEFYAITQAKEGVGTIAEQIPTVAIISVMVIIISLIAGVFVYMKYFG